MMPRHPLGYYDSRSPHNKRPLRHGLIDIAIYGDWHP